MTNAPLAGQVRTVTGDLVMALDVWTRGRTYQRRLTTIARAHGQVVRRGRS